MLSTSLSYTRTVIRWQTYFASSSADGTGSGCLGEVSICTTSARADHRKVLMAARSPTFELGNLQKGAAH
jgi:hypothetical protein